MKYEKALSYLFNQLPMFQRIGKAAYKAGLDNTLRLDKYFDHPHNKFKAVHVAGTNGKGSVSNMLASVLQEAGYKTGLYTSPHLLDFRERIRINGTMIDKGYISDFVEKHQEFFNTLQASFFEISVFMAFDYFRFCEVDVAVVEVGMGGRLDATNIIIPEISVITNISRDHAEFLGDTLEKIAAEKAGIIKKGITVIVGETNPATEKVFADKASEEDAPVIFADKIYGINTEGNEGNEENEGNQGNEAMQTGGYVYGDGLKKYQRLSLYRNKELIYKNIMSPLLGHYQQKNLITAFAVIEELKNKGYVISKDNIFKGIKNVLMNTGFSGRWQVIKDKPLVICDTAHNADGLKMVFQQVEKMNFNKLHVIAGFVSEKEIGLILPVMPAMAEYYFARLSVPRTMDEHELAYIAVLNGLRGTAFPSVCKAYSKVASVAGIDDLIIVTGSTFCVADFLADC